MSKAKKNELKSLADQEMEAIKPPPKQASTKISRLQIQVNYTILTILMNLWELIYFGRLN